MISATDLHKRFGDVEAVAGLSLEVERGEVFGLLGPNGAGKTTTIGMMVGLVAPDRGSVRIGDAGAPGDQAARRQIGIAPQSLALYDDLSGRENLHFFASLYGGTDAAERVDALLERTGLADRAGDRVKGYSGGMKRRLNIAAALVHDPSIVLLDEPTAGVDPQSRNAIFDVVTELRDEARTVIYTTHYMEEAQRLCDRVGIIDHGRLLALDTVDALIAEHGGQSAVTVDTVEGTRSLTTDDPVGALQRVMDGGDVTAVRIERPNLESVFLELTGRSLRD